MSSPLFKTATPLEPIPADDARDEVDNTYIKWAIAAGAAVVATAAGAFVLSKVLSNKSAVEEKDASPVPAKRKTMKKKKSAKKVNPEVITADNNEIFASNNVPNLSSSKPLKNLSNDELAAMIEAAAKTLEAHEISGDILLQIKSPMFVELASILLSAKPEDYEFATRLNAAKWLLRYISLELLISLEQAERSQDEIIQNSQDALQRVWAFIDIDSSAFSNAEELNQLLITKLDVSQRRQDLVGLSGVYEEVKSVESDELQMAAFHVAPMLGKWDDFLKLGKQMEKKNPGFMYNLHQMSAQQPAFPDYETLFDLVKLSRQNLPNHSLKTLQKAPRTYSIKQAGLKFLDVEGENEGVVEQIRQSLAGQEQWQEVEMEGNNSATILRNGALIQCAGFSPVQTSLIGIYEEGQFNLGGYAEQEAPGVGTIKYVEELRIARSKEDPSTWTGTSKVIQDFIPVGGVSRQQTSEMNVTMTFQIRLNIEESAM